MQTGLLTGIDYTVIIIYLLGMVGLGLWFSRYQKTAEDYFVAGRRMGWFVLSISIWVSLTSANSMLGCPGYAYEHNLQFVPVLWLLIVPIALIVIYGILPVFHSLSLTTAYTYLERRFGLNVRMLGSTLFIFLRGGWLASVIYAPSVALAAVIDIPGLTELQEISTAVVLVGVVATIYTALGGIEADMWSDVIQFFVFVGGMALIWFYVLRDVGGWNEVWRIGAETGRTFPMSSGREFWDWVLRPGLNPAVELTFLWILAGTALGGLNDMGTDQLTLQRYFSARSIKESIRALWIARISDIPLMPLLYITGTGIFAYFYVHGAQYSNLPTNADQMMPYFVAALLPVGVSGLFIAALFAATMSSVDSGINSLSAACVTDFYERLRGTRSSARSRPIFDSFAAILLAVVITAAAVAVAVLCIPALRIAVSQGGLAATVAVVVIALGVAAILCVRVTLPWMRRILARVEPEHADDAHYLRVARWATIVWGMLATVTALFVGGIGQIYRIAVSLMGFWAGPLLGIFLLALFTRRANATGAVVGAIVGAACTSVWARLGFTPWMYAFIGVVPTLVVGYLVSLATAPPRSEQIEGLTIYTHFPVDKEEPSGGA